MVLLDGKKLAQKILDSVKTDVAATKKKLRLAIVVVGGDPAIAKFIEQKRRAARSIGIDTRVYSFEDSVSTNMLRVKISKIAHEEKNTGVIIQLPLPPHINTQYILNSVMPEKDVDVLSSRAVGNFATGRSDIFPPVAGAVKAFFEEYKIDYRNKYIVIAGAGNLVGKPVAILLMNEKATFGVLRSDTKNPEEYLSRADIIVSGIGKPNFIKGNMVKDGAVIIDAGTSESEGKLVGDVDFDSVSGKASFLTPVPGGIGPVTVALLFKNISVLARAE